MDTAHEKFFHRNTDMFGEAGKIAARPNTVTVFLYPLVFCLRTHAFLGEKKSHTIYFYISVEYKVQKQSKKVSRTLEDEWESNINKKFNNFGLRLTIFIIPSAREFYTGTTLSCLYICMPLRST